MRYLRAALSDILREYAGERPLALFLKEYFRGHPKLGSRDRRALSEVAYAYYRAGRGFSSNGSIEEVALAATALFGNPVTARPLLATESLAGAEAGATAETFKRPDAFNARRLLPAGVRFSDGINPEAWAQSLLHQPHLFLRLRVPAEEVTPLLKKVGVPYRLVEDRTLVLPNGTDIKDDLPAHTYVVQDLSSRRTGDYFGAQPGEHWWDCCCGAGGKSILLQDLQPGTQLTATDIRPSILHNLQARFRRYRLPQPEVHVLDASDAAKSARLFGDRRFDALLCDAPCSGSGTWARTPEEAHFFRPEKVGDYAACQRAILLNAVRYVKPGGRIVYCTCSVFWEENEGVMDAAVAAGLELQEARLINGIAEGADCLFAAVLKKGV